MDLESETVHNDTNRDTAPSNGEVDNTDTESIKPKLRYPLAVPFIILNEFCERFNYYGMRTILVLYLTRKLLFDSNTATLLYHTFTTLVYFCCVLGAIIADSWWGKFKTILILSVVYVCGSTIIALGAIEPWNWPAMELTMVGLALIALGSGGIKPCVAAFGGEQFKMPEQAKQLALFFSFFYFSINAGSLISTSITPILRQDVQCFGMMDCYPLAFGVPAVLMITSILVFIGGKTLYKIFPPQGNMFLKVCKCIGNAISTRSRQKKTNPKDNWLDYAEEKYGKKLCLETKILLHVLMLYIPLPVFWALFDQQGSRWTFQATRMDGNIGFMEIKPDQVQVINPFLILLFIPLYEVLFYPLLNLIGVRRPLQKICLGGVLAGVAFLLSGFVEMSLEPTYPILPSAGYSQLRIYNGRPCNYKINANLIPNVTEFELNKLGMFEEKFVKVDESTKISYTLTSQETNVDCPSEIKGDFLLESNKAISYFLNGFSNDAQLERFEDNPEKSISSSPVVRVLANTRNPAHRFILSGNGIQFNETANSTITKDVPFGVYDLLVDNVEVQKGIPLRTGGVFTIVVMETTDNKFESEVITVTEPNSINILWQIPQYVIMTLGEVMYSVTGLQFSFTQAPESMKSVLQGCWQLTIAIGNLVVVFIIGAKFISSQMWEFFLFAIIMFLAMILFSWLAYRYKPISLDELQKIDEEEKLKAGEKPSPLNFPSEKTKL